MPAGVLIDLAARWIADPLRPQTLLALLKHPLVRIDLDETPRPPSGARETRPARPARPPTGPICTASLNWRPPSRATTERCRRRNIVCKRAGPARALCDRLEALSAEAGRRLRARRLAGGRRPSP
jgi:ATP-dependent helicase/nuclease subunit B